MPPAPPPGRQASPARSSHPPPQHARVAIVGGGAAGLTAAFFAAEAGATEVYVLERTREAGKKVLMSGGTRCNILPQDVDLETDYFTPSSRSALRAVFASWTLDECRAWLEGRDVGLRLALEAETRKWFPASNSGREVRDRLVAACEARGVRFVYDASVERLTPPPPPPAAAAAAAGDDGGTGGPRVAGGSSSSSSESSSSRGCWQLGLASGATVAAGTVIMAAGGSSFPAVGTDGTGWRLLRSVGHTITRGGVFPALTPLTGPHPGGEQLAGLTLAGVQLRVTKPGSSKVLAVAQRGGLLFTHRGWSGPAVLDTSHWLVQAMEQQQGAGQQLPGLVVDWTGEGADVWSQRLADAPGATQVERFLRMHGLKERLAAALVAELGLVGRPLSQLRKGEREGLLAALTAWPLPVKGHEGFKKAEVTGGGVPLEEVDSRSMQSRVQPRGLYVCGELLGVHGRIGGMNFWWAWLTGRLAGRAAAADAVC